jgi:hypothetical protein
VKPALKRLAPLVPPVLLAAYPLLSLFEQNETELPLRVVWSPLVVVAAVTAGLYGVLLIVLKQPMKAGALTALAVVAFFYWETFKSDLSGLNFSDGVLIAIWLMLFAGAALLLVRTGRSLVNVTLGLGLLAAVLAVVPAVKIASYQADHPAVRVTDSRLWPAPLPEPPRPAGGARLPDIYVIVPDDYARADVLKQYLHFDNGAFLDALKQRGFVISDQVRSPYSDSESNIAAELNMGYLTGLGGILGQKSQDVRPLKTLIEENRAERLLKPLGYRYLHIDTDEVTYAGGNPDISSVATPDSFTSLWLQKSLLRLVGGPFGFSDSAAETRYRDAIRSGFSQLASAPDQPNPKFVVFHTLLPHDPYVFGARGQSVSFPSDNEEELGSKLGMSYYVPQLQSVSQRLLDTVDAIKAKSSTPPVIVIVSDEGFESTGDVFNEATMQQIRVKGLLAMYLPGVRNPRPPQPPNTVNALRVVFNSYLGTHYPMLRSASYPEGDFPYQFEEMRVK